MKPVRLTKHAREQAQKRGATEAEVYEAVLKGACETAKRGRLLFRYNFAYNHEWQGTDYPIKQVAPVVKGGVNEMVVKLYELTEEEIAIIENKK